MSSSVLDSATGVPTSMPVPQARGPLSATLVSILRSSADPREITAAADAYEDAQSTDLTYDILRDDDAQLTLTVLYELHLQGIENVSDKWEWNPDLLAVRSRLEERFESAIAQLVGTVESSGDVVADLWSMTAPSAGPGLASFMAKDATIDQFSEVLIHRSLNQLREADVHTLGISRLSGAVKAALVEVQSDEYGGGRAERMHSRLFADTMRAVGLSDRYGHYIDSVPAVTLASLNALSLFGFHRRHLGTLVGHLCAVETTSALPSKRYSAGLRRLGFSSGATLFYDEHVEADSVHEQIAVRDLAGGLASSQPHRTDDILFGAAACLAFDDLLGDHLTSSWEKGKTSLRE
ncbi:hypothetical protein ABIE52_003157 [Rhodococcus sp. OAS809]|uniref:iron-containing redox enzyme family protein n=1 Tax=Rhodococcus sp. OAS809 TaxID=2663874 RepID=UPI00178BD39C